MIAPRPSQPRQTPTGWADDRLMQAYDLLHEAWTAHKSAEDTMPELRALLDGIEAADNVLADVLRERETDCCDAGKVWNNADPTSGMWVPCEVHGGDL
jgi:hypothetical protein